MCLQNLKTLNFRDLIHLRHSNIEEYSFGEYRSNGFQHPPAEGYCTACERKGCNNAQPTRDDKDVSDVSLLSVSHGSHTKDYLDAALNPIETEDWRTESVMFLYESPGYCGGRMYEEVPFNSYNKRVSKEWYWVHSDLNADDSSYPRGFRGRVYGEFIYSAILTFKLKNAYVTNLVKCGMSKPDGKSRNLAYFSPDCVTLCYNQFLKREIQLLKPRVVFTLSSRTHDWLTTLIKAPSFHLRQLPHPARGQGGFTDEYYRVLYFWLTVEALYKAKMLSMQEAQMLTATFLTGVEKLK